MTLRSYADRDRLPIVPPRAIHVSQPHGQNALVNSLENGFKQVRVLQGVKRGQHVTLIGIVCFRHQLAGFRHSGTTEVWLAFLRQVSFNRS